MKRSSMVLDIAEMLADNLHYTDEDVDKFLEDNSELMKKLAKKETKDES